MPISTDVNIPFANVDEIKQHVGGNGAKKPLTDKQRDGVLALQRYEVAQLLWVCERELLKWVHDPTYLNEDGVRRWKEDEAQAQAQLDAINEERRTLHWASDDAGPGEEDLSSQTESETDGGVDEDADSFHAYHAYHAPSNSTETEQTETEPWPKLEKEALYGLAGDIVSTIDPHTEADPVSVLLNVLTAFGSCLNANAFAAVGKDVHHGRLFSVLVGESSKGRKGTGWSIPRYLFSLVDPDWTKGCVKGGLSSAEGLMYSVRDAVYKKQPVKEKGRVVDYEQVMVEEAVTDKRLLIIEPEFASTLTVMNREGNTLSPVLRDAWDSGNLSTLTRNSPLKATGAHISLIGHITKPELLARLDDTSRANGFANRILFSLVRRSKELPEGGSVPEEELLKLAERLQRALAFSRTVSLVQRDEEAKALWAEVYHDLSEAKPGLVGAIIARAEAQVLRMSLLYSLLDKSDVVRVNHLRAALALWEYCEQSALLIFGERLGDPTADRILDALRTAGPEGMSENDIYELFGKHKSANERARALTLLLSLDLITSEIQQTGGRPRTIYKLRGKRGKRGKSADGEHHG